MNLPNFLTIIRMALVPVFIVFFYMGQSGGQVYFFLAFVVFVAASATDAVDGHIARKYDLITNFGKLMDPLADKVLTTAALIIFVDVGMIPAWVVIVILAREFIITGLRGVAASEGVVIAAGRSGKLKTFFQMTAICFILLAVAILGQLDAVVLVNPELSLMIFTGAVADGVFLQAFGALVAFIGIVLMWAAVVFTVYSGVEYLWKGRKLLNTK